MHFRRRLVFGRALCLLTLFSGLMLIAIMSLVNPSHAASEYKLPVPEGLEIVVTRGASLHDHGYDLALLDENPYDDDDKPFTVVAARGGRVIATQFDSTTTCSDLDTKDDGTDDPGCWTKGNYVLIDHEDAMTAGLYLHLAPNSIIVSPGDRVQRGQTLATAGNTGWSTKLHLHFHVEVLPCSTAVHASYIEGSEEQKECKERRGWWWTTALSASFGDESVLNVFSNGMPTSGSFVSSNTPPADPDPQRVPQTERPAPDFSQPEQPPSARLRQPTSIPDSAEVRIPTVTTPLVVPTLPGPVGIGEIPTPRPTAVPIPTATPTLEPTSTPEPTMTPTPAPRLSEVALVPGPHASYGEVTLRKLDTASDVQITSRQETLYTNVQFSPDGRYLMYLHSPKNLGSLYVRDLETNHEAMLANGAHVSCAAFLPNDDWLYWVTTDRIERGLAHTDILISYMRLEDFEQHGFTVLDSSRLLNLLGLDSSSGAEIRPFGPQQGPQGCHTARSTGNWLYFTLGLNIPTECDIDCGAIPVTFRIGGPDGQLELVTSPIAPMAADRIPESVRHLGDALCLTIRGAAVDGALAFTRCSTDILLWDADGNWREVPTGPVEPDYPGILFSRVSLSSSGDWIFVEHHRAADAVTEIFSVTAWSYLEDVLSGTEVATRQ